MIMKRIFKNFFRHKIKPACAGRYVLLFFCLAFLTAPLLTNAQSPLLPTSQQPALLQTGAQTAQPSSAVDYLRAFNTAASLNPLTAVTNYAAGKVAGGVSYILGVVIGWIVYVINYIIASIFGVAVGILAWLISIVLQLNTNIVQSNIVTSGFGVTLALANLGFVLAIIVIAIMTILRYETYALKQTLWKLVAAAILVNFSLVICAAILNFADTLTLYFLNAFNPGGSISAFDSFSTSLAGGFAPQRVFLNLNAQGQSFTDTNYDKFAGAGTNFAATLVALMNLFFPTLFLMVSVIALGGLFIMLLIRYVYLGILLILMPMAWLLWIFPVTSSQWHKWWSYFIKWTIFAPVVMFFLYLALMTLGGANANQVNDPNSFFNGLGITNNANSPIAGFVSTSLGGSTPTFGSIFLGSFLQMVMMVAMVFAGLFMANSMGIMFADATLKGAKAVTSGFAGFAKRRGIIGAGWAMNKARIPQLAEKLQKGVGAKPKGFLRNVAKYTGLEFAGQKLGQGIQAVHVATREGAVDEAKKLHADYEERQHIDNFPGATNPERINTFRDAYENGYLKKLNLRDFLSEDLFKSYHEEKLYKDITGGKGGVIDEEAIKAIVEMEEARMKGESLDDAAKKLDDAMKKLVTGATKAGMSSNRNIGDGYASRGGTFGGMTKEETQLWLRSLTRNIMTENSVLISSMIPKMDSKERTNFAAEFNESMAELRKERKGDEKGLKALDDLQKAYNRIIINNTTNTLYQPSDREEQRPRAQQTQNEAPPADGGVTN